MHDGSVLGGALAPGFPTAQRTNYDSETVHRIDVLAQVWDEDVLYIFDSTSPIEASDHFRRSSCAARMDFALDEWMATTMALEDEQRSLVYFWSRSHCGHVLEAAVDMLAKDFLEGTPVDVPRTVCRHASGFGYAAGSNRALALWASAVHMVRSYAALATTKGARASAGEMDVLRGARMTERQCVHIMRLRDDHANLRHSRRYVAGGDAHSAGAYVRCEICPCGGGVQSRSHLLWWCTLPGVARRRVQELLPAVVTHTTALSAGEPVTGLHATSVAVMDALRGGGAPESGGWRYLLGLVVRPSNARVPVPARCGRAVLLAVLGMHDAMVSASARGTSAAVARSHRHARLRRALAWLRLHTWLHPMPVQAVAATHTRLLSRQVLASALYPGGRKATAESLRDTYRLADAAAAHVRGACVDAAESVLVAEVQLMALPTAREAAVLCGRTRAAAWRGGDILRAERAQAARTLRNAQHHRRRASMWAEASRAFTAWLRDWGARALRLRAKWQQRREGAERAAARMTAAAQAAATRRRGARAAAQSGTGDGRAAAQARVRAEAVARRALAAMPVRALDSAFGAVVHEEGGGMRWAALRREQVGMIGAIFGHGAQLHPQRDHGIL